MPFDTRLLAGFLALALTGCATFSKLFAKREPGEGPPPAHAGDPTPAKAPAVSKETAALNAEYHFSLAQSYSVEGHSDRAIEEYRLTLMYDPASALVHTRLAAEQVKKGELSSAVDSCKAAVALEPNCLDAHLLLAGLYSTAHQNEEALAEYEKVLKIDPHHEDAVVYKSQVLVELARPKEARATIKGYLAKHADSAVAWYYLGRLESTEGNLAPAVAAFRKAMDARPGFSQAAMALGYLYEERKQNAEAIKIYQQAYEGSQDVAAAGRIATLLLKEEKYQEAVPYLEMIQSVDPDDLNSRVKLGLIQMELKRFDEAIANFKSILEKNPDSDRVHFYLGSVYEETKKFREAIGELRKISADSKLFPDAALHVAYLHKLLGEKSEALGYLKELVNQPSRVPGFYVLYANIEEENNEVARAISVLESGALKFPEDEKIRYYLGNLYDKVGEVDKCLAQMELILKTNPDNVDALNYLGYTWTIRGTRLTDAGKLIQKALKLRPDNGYILDSWGWYLYTTGRYREAVVELEKAARLKPNEVTILEHLADVYVRTSLWERAAQSYESAVQFAQDDTTKKKIQEKLESVRGQIVRGADGTERLPAGGE